MKPRSWANCCNVRGLSFCCVPKNASTSIKKTLILSVGEEPADVPNYHSHPCLNRSFPEEATGFRAGVFRDPVDRCVSTWMNKLWRNSPDNSSTRGFLNRGFEMKMTLRDYLEHLPSVIDEDAHTVSQKAFLTDNMDDLRTMEKLPELWASLQKRFSWLQDLPHLNTTVRPEEFELPDYLRAKIELIYKDDMEAYRALKDKG
jgi:hypothetical protein